MKSGAQLSTVEADASALSVKRSEYPHRHACPCPACLPPSLPPHIGSPLAHSSALTLIPKSPQTWSTTRTDVLWLREQMPRKPSKHHGHGSRPGQTSGSALRETDWSICIFLCIMGSVIVMGWRNVTKGQAPSVGFRWSVHAPCHRRSEKVHGKERIGKA